jgi:hypothetical protein
LDVIIGDFLIEPVLKAFNNIIIIFTGVLGGILLEQAVDIINVVPDEVLILCVVFKRFVVLLECGS